MGPLNGENNLQVDEKIKNRKNWKILENFKNV